MTHVDITITRATLERTHEMSIFKRIAINHAHPTKLVFDLIAFIWMSYFLWMNDLSTALIVGFSLSIFGTLLTFNADSDQLAMTSLGKYVLARLHPANLLFQIAGYFYAMYGLWMHQASIILAGLSLVIFGHLWGWKGRVIP